MGYTANDAGNLPSVDLGWTVVVEEPVPSPSSGSAKFVPFGSACGDLAVEGMYGYILDSPSTGEYEDCVCDADTPGSHAVTVSEAMAYPGHGILLCRYSTRFILIS